jgi:uncharacterized protein YukE
MEVLNRNQRTAALWRLSGLYAATIGIMGVIVFQSFKAYRSRADAQYQQDLKAAIDNEKKLCAEALSKEKNANILDAFKTATSSMVQDVKQAQNKSASSMNGSSVQSSLNSASNNVQQVKAAQTTVKTIGTTLNELNPLKK